MADDTDNTEAELRIASLTDQIERLNAATSGFGRVLTRSLAAGVVQGKSFEDVLRNIGQRMLDLALRNAMKPLEGVFSSLGSTLTSGLGNALQGIGASAERPAITPFAEGGVVNAPHLFPIGRGLGLMGERGAEAILPLSRGPDGRLGVAAAGNARNASIVFNVSTPDAESFRRSEAQLSAMLARAVARGKRGL